MTNPLHVEIGRQGGKVETHGKPAGEKQQIDIDVNKGSGLARR